MPVKSSDLKSVGYDPPTRTLEVEFKRGRVYRYEGVPPDIFEKMSSARSIGKFFHQNIVRGDFRFKRIGKGGS